MNETESAKLFNEELDALLAGRRAGRASDPGALALAGELARADFSGEAAIRETLRSRLVGEEATLLVTLRALFSNNYARFALAAAVLVIALLPLARRQGLETPAVPAQSTADLSPVPALPQASRPLPVPPVAARPAVQLFASIPMPRLETELIREFPIAPAGAGLQLTVAEGRPITRGEGPGIVLETESAPFPIERREIKPEDLFVRRVL